MIKNDIKPSYGEIWLINLDPTVGHEQAKKRPCVVISNNIFNYGPAELVVIIPLTSKYRNLSWLIKVDPPEGGLSTTSYVISNQIRTVSKKRLSSEPIGKLTKTTMIQIKLRLQILLNL